MKPYELNLAELSKLLHDGGISAVEVTESYLERIAGVDPPLNSFITVTADEARAMAREADRRLAAGDPSPLCGVPVALKDILLTRGVRTTCASRMLAGFVPPYDSTAWRRLAEGGAVLLGKLNMDEFAMGSSSETSFFGPTRNPWDPERVPGGSSGGSAAAVAARLAAGTLGTDTGGSIRQPASHCGCVGLKPTYGRVSRYGVIAYASSLDQVGPVARTVEDAALLLQAIAGHDPLDSTSVDRPVPDYRQALIPDLKGVRIGLPMEYFGEGVDPAVRSIVEKGIERCRELGAELVELSLPHTPHAVACYYLIATAEASSNLARYDGVRFGHRCEGNHPLVETFSRSRAQGFGTEVKRRIMLGTHALSSGYYDAYYLTAQKVRRLILDDFTRAFETVDLLLTPVAPTPAFRIGEKTEDPLTMYLSDIFTIPVNLAGTCALSVPAGFTEEGLPVGVQFIGRPFDEQTLLRGGHAFERAGDAWRRFPLMEGRG